LPKYSIKSNILSGATVFAKWANMPSKRVDKGFCWKYNLSNNGIKVFLGTIFGANLISIDVKKRQDIVGDQACIVCRLYFSLERGRNYE